LKKEALVLDIGCGNDSARKIKSLRKDIFYVGVDIVDYNQSEESIKSIDIYKILDKFNFHNELDLILRDFPFDAVIWSHNIEHLNDFESVLECIVRRLKSNAKILISFPNIFSLSFPNRKGTLNFFDDPTHVNVIEPSWLINYLIRKNFKINLFRLRNRSIVPALIGLILEPFSILSGRVLPGTRDLYGIETILWAEKK